MEIRYLVMASPDLEKSRNGTLLGPGGAGRVVGSLAGFDVCWSPRGPLKGCFCHRVNFDLCRLGEGAH